MENIYINQKISFKTVIGLITVCILLSVLIPVGSANSSDIQPGTHCNSGDTDPNFNCYYNKWLAKIGTACNVSSDCAGSATNLMGCFAGKCLGRHAHPCEVGVVNPQRDSTDCAPGFHCDINNIFGRNYCEGNHISVPKLTISKKSRNITDNTSWNEITEADPSEKVAFSIIIKAEQDSSTVNNVNINDLLPYKLTYISGSTKIDGSSVPNGIISGGINIGSLSPGQSKEIVFEANVFNENYFSVGQTTLNNIAGAWATGISKLTDIAKLIIKKKASTNPNLVISKSINKTNANPGDEIVYTLNYENTGDGLLELKLVILFLMEQLKLRIDLILILMKLV